MAQSTGQDPIWSEVAMACWIVVPLVLNPLWRNYSVPRAMLDERGRYKDEPESISAFRELDHLA